MRKKRIRTDLLIIGGGTAGCYAALTLGSYPECSVLIVEKAHIQRSGCLAAGVNALNAYITKGHTPEEYASYAREDAAGIVRNDLLISMSRRLNRVTEELERRGLVILKDENGAYVSRGWRNLKINGENIKPILANAACAQENVSVLNHVAVTDLKMTEQGVSGAVGFSVTDDVFYEIDAEAVLIATAGAAGLYRPNHPGFSRHKMWYPPFNTGAGYAMGILAGAEMTTLEMRFVALRCRDTIAPTGTIAQGVSARQINALGEDETVRYGVTTQARMYGVTQENAAGRGPSYLETRGISKNQEEALYRAYLNMAPAQTMRWIETGRGPSEENVAIEGTEPYVVGGHTAGGYWVDTDRETTIPGLFAAGDVCGGSPQKYVTGACAEAEIAAEAIAARLADRKINAGVSEKSGGEYIPTWEGRISAEEKLDEYRRFLAGHTPQKPGAQIRDLEEKLQMAMDLYAGGIAAHYTYTEQGLNRAREALGSLRSSLEGLSAADHYELMKLYELRERLITAEALVSHLLARKETRWPGFGVYLDYRERSDAYDCYINSRLEGGSIRTLRRPLVTGSDYRHKDAASKEAAAAGDRDT